MKTQQIYRLYDGVRAMSVSQSDLDGCTGWLKKSIAAFGGNDNTHQTNPFTRADGEILHGAWGESVLISDGNRVLSLGAINLLDYSEWLSELIAIYRDASDSPVFMMSIRLVETIYMFKITPDTTFVNSFDMATLSRDSGRFNSREWETEGVECVDNADVLKMVILCI